MKAIGSLAALAAVQFGMQGMVQAQEEGSDHPMVGRFESGEIIDYEHLDFDEYVLLTEAVTGRVEWSDPERERFGRRLEGAVTRITYESPASHTSLEVMRAYEEALAANGFRTIFQCANADCGGRNFNHAVVPYSLSFSENYDDQRYIAATLTNTAEGDVHVMIYTVKAYSIGGERRNRVYTQVDVIEERARTSRVIVKAEEMAEKLESDGKVALYGLYFDSNSAEIRPDSRPTLDEIARLMEEHGSLQLLVVGHTDNDGSFDYNIDLSRRRAESVTAALVGDYGMEHDRLRAWGVGYAAPVASSADEAGKALNRRVELVPE